jgi:hypothetical protein
MVGLIGVETIDFSCFIFEEVGMVFLGVGYCSEAVEGLSLSLFGRWVLCRGGLHISKCFQEFAIFSSEVAANDEQSEKVS